MDTDATPDRNGPAKLLALLRLSVPAAIALVGLAAGPGINSRVLQRNDRFSYTFDTPGTSTCICSIHPFLHGTVVVTG
jgi:hypothetical protein